jgi:hypothetical protein
MRRELAYKKQYKYFRILSTFVTVRKSLLIGDTLGDHDASGFSII